MVLLTWGQWEFALVVSRGAEKKKRKKYLLASIQKRVVAPREKTVVPLKRREVLVSFNRVYGAGRVIYTNEKNLAVGISSGRRLNMRPVVFSDEGFRGDCVRQR